MARSYRLSIFLTIILGILALSGFSQKGPGGVSHDADNDKNCRLWLDAGDLTELADGDSVIVWYDKSVSAVRDSAYRDPAQAHKYTFPVFRNSPGASINGKPVVSFEYGGMLGIGSWPAGEASADLNSNLTQRTTYEQTIFFALRTSNDVSERQVVWDEGGAERGLVIYIYDGYVYLGVVDISKDKGSNIPGDVGDTDWQTLGPVDPFGFTYKRLPVLPNTTYVLVFKYDVPRDNKLIYNNTTSTHTGLTGTLNGQAFPSTMTRGGGPGYYCHGCATAVGGIYLHPDPVGIGGVNQGSYHEQGRIFGGYASPMGSPLDVERRNIPTGTHLFKGRIAEIAYYAYALNPAEQIIVENYLAAKYFANVIENDKYIYESGYGNGVIGIGREQAGSNYEYNGSQGDNLFEISVANMATFTNNTPRQYLLTGHNNASLTWTPQNTPDSASIQRLRRIWRWDQTGGNINTSKTIHIKLDAESIAKLPPLPAGFSKYGVLIGDRNQPLANFSANFSQTIELIENGDSLYADVPILDGNYFTICAIKPVVQFRVSTDFEIEGNIGTTPKLAYLDLNYKPAPTSTFNVEYTFMDGTATKPNDYTYTPSSPAVFNFGQISRPIAFKIVNDATVVNDLPVEYFTINITSADNGLVIGPRSTLTYSIYDNDPPPKVSFESATIDFNENAGTVNIPVKVIGELENNATATVEYVTGEGTATLGSDFEVISPQVMHFSPSTLTDNFVLKIKEDLTDEYDEYFKLRITGTTGDLGFDETLNIEIQINIIDNDLEPSVSFVSESSEGYESISKPQILVNLSARSAKTITAPFYLGDENLGTGTASNGAVTSPADYDANPEGGTLVFEPGDSVQVLYRDNTTDDLYLTVYGNDESPEPDETIIFKLDENPGNATLGSIGLHTYTIKDYTEYEWQGLAGVGKVNDNTIWMVPNEANDGSNIPNLSPRPIQITQTKADKKPGLTTPAAGMNNKKLLTFDGTKQALVVGGSNETSGHSSLIQTAAFYDSKAIFFVFVPQKVNSPVPQCVFEAGGEKTGMSIYIRHDTLYFQAWGWQDNLDPHVLWGLDPLNNKSGLAYVKYAGLVAGTPYIVSCHYQNTQSGNPILLLGGLSIFVNGELKDTYTGPVDRLQSTSGSAAIGAVLYQTRFLNTVFFSGNPASNVPASGKSNYSNFFKGKMGDFLYYNEPSMNLARIRIISNLLSARYNIPLAPGFQDFDLAFANNITTTKPDFNNEVAGVGIVSEQFHGDSKGKSELRVRNPHFNSNTAFVMWGHNNESLTNIWPVSSAVLPPSVRERSAKVWRFTANPVNGTNTADFSIRYSNAQNAPAFSGDPNLLKLLVSTDPDDFSAALVYPVSDILQGHIAAFDSVPITNGMYVTLGNTSAIYPLPIELLNFEAKLNGTSVDISWTTSSEYNNEYFEVERAGSDLKWEVLTRVAGAGNSNTLLRYFERDYKPLSGINYYRLKQVDYDGSFKYSDVVSVLNNTANATEDIYLFPNPTKSGRVYLRLPSAFAKADAQISIYNVSGIKVNEAILKDEGALRELNCHGFAPGVYFVNISLPYLTETKKLVIQ